MSSKASKRSTAVIAVFGIGILAIAVLLIISIAKKYPLIFLIAQAIVLLCLIYLLVSSMVARKKVMEQDSENSKHPYGQIDQKEINRIFDMIDKEEQRRGRAMTYTVPEAAVEKPVDTVPTKEPEVQEESESHEDAEPEDEERLPIIFPDKDEAEIEKKAFSPISEERAAARREEKEKEKEKEKGQAVESPQAEDENSSTADEIAALAAAASGDVAPGEEIPPIVDNAERTDEQRQKGKGGKGGRNMDNKPKKRQPVYYDQYGRPIAPPMRQTPAQPVGYDQYGRPVYAQRPPQKKPRPIGFDQNGRPIYPPAQRKPRVPVGYDQYGRPIYAPTNPAAGRQRPAGQRPAQGQRRRPAAAGAVPGTAPIAEQPTAPQIPTEPMAASAADALAALEANAAGNTAYYDEDYIPVVVHTEEDYNYSDDRYTPRVRAGIMTDAPVSTAMPVTGTAGVQMPTVTADEYNSSGSDVYRPDYAGEDIPVVVPVFEDMEVDYSATRGFTPMNDPFAQKGYAPPVYNPEPIRTEAPLSPTPIYQNPNELNPEYNAKSAADYTRDEDEERFVYVPHFDDDDPIPVTPQAPAVPHWKLAKMRRRKVTRRSRRGMLFKLKSDKFSEYMETAKGNG